jgi:hypothetical protein
MFNELPLGRRQLLRRVSAGFGSVALAALLADEGLVAGDAKTVNKRSPMRPKSPHFTPRAKNVIFLFMEGGVSQVDSFDYKPMLQKHHGKNPRQAIGKLENTQFNNIGKVMKPVWKFQQRGESGTWVSDLFPHIAKMADEFCVVKSAVSNFPEHTSANYFLHSGMGLQGRPSMGAWVTYGLGSFNQNLPGYVVLNGGQIPSGGLDNFGAGFLPATYQGSLLHATGTPLANVTPNEKVQGLQAAKRKLVRRLNQDIAKRAGPVDALESAIAKFELAARMQVAIPRLMDLSDETAATRKMYGIDAKYVHTRTYARECMIARRLVERGVRFVELTVPMVNGYQRWDAHTNVAKNHGTNALAVDQPIAALLKDLRQRGLLDDTLVVWTGEFGRTPFAQGGRGRDHNEHGFSMWMAGGGIRGGITYGETDEWGYRAVHDRVEIHDLHATMLHLLGIDHTKLTYRFSGRDIRLTDVHGQVLRKILA